MEERQYKTKNLQTRISTFTETQTFQQPLPQQITFLFLRSQVAALLMQFHYLRTSIPRVNSGTATKITLPLPEDQLLEAQGESDIHVISPSESQTDSATIE
ncbi:hypothetical protein ElyMa_000556900 [Elysia marginata]|uniref:Uncharacterized protein n=1 Tax=Elysia marginata TaxID=1093978 RepID=A0AAV4G2T0_9GAST|nr:hypothetical protein ElyMa_000556900 [Elysia marginata]